jgi:hypothetical protein
MRPKCALPQLELFSHESVFIPTAVRSYHRRYLNVENDNVENDNVENDTVETMTSTG